MQTLGISSAALHHKHVLADTAFNMLHAIRSC